MSRVCDVMPKANHAMMSSRRIQQYIASGFVAPPTPFAAVRPRPKLHTVSASEMGMQYLIDSSTNTEPSLEVAEQIDFDLDSNRVSTSNVSFSFASAKNKPKPKRLSN